MTFPGHPAKLLPLRIQPGSGLPPGRGLPDNQLQFFWHAVVVKGKCQGLMFSDFVSPLLLNN